MKRILRPLLLLMALAALMSISVFAAEPELGSGFYDIGTANGVTLTPKTAASQAAQKLNVCWGTDDTATPSALYSDSVKLDMTISNAVEGKQYLVMISDSDALPTIDTSIYYIDQIAKTGGALTFNLYPMQIAGSGETKQVYLHITSNADGFERITIPMSYACEMQYVEPAFRLGYVNDDDVIDSDDAMLTLKIFVGSYSATPTQLLAAEVTGDGVVDSDDAMDMLKYFVGSITKFKAEQ